MADALRAELRLGEGLARFPSGSVPVFAAGDDHVIKLFPTDEAAFFETEKAALRRIDGTLSIPTPRVIAAGEREGWWYVAMTRLRGRSLAEIWPALGLDERRRLMREVGVALRELHALPTEGLDTLCFDWATFIEGQKRSCRERQAARGLAPAWLDGLDGFLARWSPEDDGGRCLLHTEIMREHLLVEERGGRWRLSGLFDFEPAVVGAPGYELAAVGIFLACAEPGMLAMVLDGYGTGLGDDDALAPTIMAWALLHRYSHLRWYMERLPVRPESRDLEALARDWFTP